MWRVTLPQRAAPPPRPIEPLPVLRGVPPNDLQPGARLDAAQVQAALRLLLAFDESPMSEMADLNTIDISARDVLLVTTTQHREVTFRSADLDQQLRRRRAVHDFSQNRGKAIAWPGL